MGLQGAGPDPGALRIVAVGIRDLLRNMNQADPREEIPHPLGAELAGDGFAFQGAKEDGDLVRIGSGEVNEETVAVVGWHEAANDCALAGSCHGASIINEGSGDKLTLPLCYNGRRGNYRGNLPGSREYPGCPEPSLV